MRKYFSILILNNCIKNNLIRGLFFNVIFLFNITLFAQTWTPADINVVRSDGSPTYVGSDGTTRITSSNSDFWKGTAFWNKTPINLTQDFNFCFETFFGCDDAGADGMVFVLQNDPRGINAIGALGGAMAYGGGGAVGTGGIKPSIGIEFDT